MKAMTISSLALAMTVGQFATAQTIFHLDFEGQTAGSPLTAISADGLDWFPFAGTSEEDPLGSDNVPGAELRSDSAAPTLLSADFGPGFGYLEAEANFDLPDTGWTIEAFVYFNVVGGFQTILGLDKDVLDDVSDAALLYFQKRWDDRFYCSFRYEVVDNGDGTFTANYAEAYSEERALVENKWYHVAVVYDPTAQTLSAYVDGVLEGQGAAPSNIEPVTDPFFQFYSVGRGQWAGNSVDALDGYIDDLRVTGAVLSPGEFLGAPADTGNDCPADMNGDGMLDIDDVLMFLSAFAAGCP